jgi:hypothetical protein
MKQKMINRFPTILAHTTPDYNQYIPVLKMIHPNILSNATVQLKNETFRGTLTHQTLLQGKLTPVEPLKHHRKNRQQNFLFLKVSTTFNPPLSRR